MWSLAGICYVHASTVASRVCDGSTQKQQQRFPLRLILYPRIKLVYASIAARDKAAIGVWAELAYRKSCGPARPVPFGRDLHLR
jgi:hypothetical protein